MANLKQILMISADCHAGPLPETYREYLESSVLDEYASWVAEAEAMRAKRRSLFEGKFMSMPDIEKILTPIIPDFTIFVDLWANTPLHKLSLTSVGIAIGYSNMKRIGDFTADLSVWIK